MTSPLIARPIPAAFTPIFAPAIPASVNPRLSGRPWRWAATTAPRTPGIQSQFCPMRRWPFAEREGSTAKAVHPPTPGVASSRSRPTRTNSVYRISYRTFTATMSRRSWRAPSAIPRISAAYAGFSRSITWRYADARRQISSWSTRPSSWNRRRYIATFSAIAAFASRPWARPQSSGLPARWRNPSRPVTRAPPTRGPSRT